MVTSRKWRVTRGCARMRNGRSCLMGVSRPGGTLGSRLLCYIGKFCCQSGNFWFRIFFNGNRIVFGYFDQDSWFSYTDMCVQLIWLCNILLNFFMMFIDNQQKLEKRFGKILRKYLTSYFIGDLCSILPWYVLGSSSARKSMYWVTATCFLRTGFVNGIVYQF